MNLRTSSALLFSTAALAAFAAAPAAADTIRTIGIDGGSVLPTGDWGDSAGLGLGALARMEMPLAPKLTLSARLGYFHHLSKESDGTESSTSEIPLFTGVRYQFSGTEAAQLYGAAELGFVIARISLENNGQSMSDSDTNLGMSLGGGYRKGKLDLRANLFFPDVGELGDALGLMATVGYDLTTL